jgi:hypothetical protein
VQLVCVFMSRVAKASSPELLCRAAPPRRAPRRLCRTFRTALDSLAVSRASPWCRLCVQLGTPARFRAALANPPPSAAARRRNPLPLALAATCSRWIEIQRVGLDRTQVNTGQIGLTSPFCKKAPEFLGFTNRSFRSRKFFTV